MASDPTRIATGPTKDQAGFDAPFFDPESDQLIRTQQLLLTAIAAAIGILSLIFASTSDPAVEGFHPGVAFAVIPAGLVLLSMLSSHVQKYCNQYWRGFLYLLVIWMAVLTFLNRFAPQCAGGLLYVVTVACAAFNVGLKKKRHVLLFSIFIVGLGACILFTAPGSGVSRALLASALAGVAFVSYPVSIWRLQTHNRLASSEQRFRTLAHAAFEGLLIIQDDTIIDHNDRAVQLFGLTDPPHSKVVRSVTYFLPGTK